MQEIHSSHRMHLERVEFDLKSAHEAVPALETRMTEVSERYSFYQEMKLYLRDLLSCLNEKVPVVEECESKMHMMWQEHAVAVSAARRQAVADAFAVFGFMAKSGGRRLYTFVKWIFAS